MVIQLNSQQLQHIKCNLCIIIKAKIYAISNDIHQLHYYVIILQAYRRTSVINYYDYIIVIIVDTVHFKHEK